MLLSAFKEPALHDAERAAHGRVEALVSQQHHLLKPIRVRAFQPVPRTAQNRALTSCGVILRFPVADDSHFHDCEATFNGSFEGVNIYFYAAFVTAFCCHIMRTGAANRQRKYGLPPKMKSLRTTPEMNRIRDVILAATAALLIASWFYPPWILHRDRGIVESAGYKFLFTADAWSGVLIVDWGRLMCADAIIAGVGFVLIVLFSRRAA